MPHVDFSQLPNHAKLWVFTASRTLDAQERTDLLGTVDAFLASWTAHGEPLTCGRDMRYDRFLFVAIDEQQAGVSGCSIDALTRSLKDLEWRLQIALLDNGPVVFRRGDEIERVDRGRFGDLADAGDVTAETTVFDNTVPTVGDLRAGQWETAARHTWHGRVFFSPRPAAG